jgi:SM-20-related protein
MQSPSLNLISEQQLQALLNDQVVVLDDFLDLAAAQALLAKAQSLHQQNLFTAAGIGAGSAHHHQIQIRGDSIYWLTENLAVLDDLLLQFNEKLYWGLTHYECHLAHYAPGQGYQEHIDQPLKQSFFQGERKISFVLYLNPAWQKGDGGEFIYKDSRQNMISVEPLFNRLVFFRSDTVPHSVAPAKKARWSLTGWMRRS